MMEDDADHVMYSKDSGALGKTPQTHTKNGVGPKAW